MTEYLGTTPAGALERASEINNLAGKPLAMDAAGRLLPVVDDNRDEAECFITVDDSGRLVLVDPPVMTGIVQMESRENYSVFLTADGRVYTCGDNSYGQLGRAIVNGSGSSANLGMVEGLPHVRQIAGRRMHSFFLSLDGVVYSCGYNGSGQLGRAVTTGNTTSINLGTVEGLPKIHNIICGEYHTHFIADDGTVYNCGDNAYGQLGRAVASANATSVNLGAVEGLSNVAQSISWKYTSHFITVAGNVYNCGYNGHNQLGRVAANGSPTIVNLGRIDAIPEIICISSHTYHSLFLTSDGTVYSSGFNNLGQLGRAVASGSQTLSNLGIIDGLFGVTQILAGYNHSLFLTSDGKVFSCGTNNYGELGRAVSAGSATSVNLGPVDGLANVVQIASGSYSYNGGAT